MKTGFNVYAVRALQDDEVCEIGTICRESYDWDYENDCSTYETTGETLDGTCGYHLVNVDADSTESEIIEVAKAQLKNCNYYGQKVIIGGKRYEFGEDFNEVIIEDAEILEIL